MGTDVKKHRIDGKMTPFFTETELEVAVILNELTGLLRDPGDRPLDPPHPTWGARRRRRLRRSSSSPPEAIPEDDPSPSTSLLAHDDETKGDAAEAAAPAAGSPLSPLSFPPSGGEEPEPRPPLPPPPPPIPLPPPTNLPATKPSSKNSKHPNERIKEFRNMITSLCAERDFLRREIEQYKIHCTTLKKDNSQLRERTSKLLENQIALPEPPPSTVGAPPTDSAAERRQRSQAKRKVEFEFDLNNLSEEAAAAAAAAEGEAAAAATAVAAEGEAAAADANADADAAARSACKAAIAAEARRRRMEIQRAKSAAAAAGAGSMPSTAHKMPRLR